MPLENLGDYELADESEIIIDEQFSKLVPELSNQEYSSLKASIKKDGCLMPLIVWNEILIDGHNRYKICQENNIKFQTINKYFKDRDEAEIFIYECALSRRSILPLQRIGLTHRLKEVIQRQAKKNQIKSGGDKKSSKFKEKSVSTKSDEPIKEQISTISAETVKPIRTSKELAKKAGVSEDTYRKGEYILEHATEETKAKLLSGETKINTEYKKLKEPEKIESKIILNQSEIEYFQKIKEIIFELAKKRNLTMGEELKIFLSFIKRWKHYDPKF